MKKLLPSHFLHLYLSEVIVKFTEYSKKDFKYYIVKRIADIDNDGTYGLLADIDYSKRTGLYLHKPDGKECKIIVEGLTQKYKI